MGTLVSNLGKSIGVIVGENPFVTALGILLCLGYLNFFAFRALVEFEIEIDTPNLNYFKIYWADHGQGYSESNMRQVLISNHHQKYQMFLSNFDDLARLRIDPIEYPGVAKFKNIQISQLGYEKISLNPEQQLAELKVIQQIEPLKITDNALILQTTGRDSQLELAIDPVRSQFLPLVHVINVIIIFITFLWLSRALGFLFKDYLFVPCFLTIILVLAAIMAAITGFSVHPDESVHLSAVSYYGDHLFPPPIDSPAAANTFSVYGYSRLANYEIYYILAGYFTNILGPFQLPELTEARIFGLFLLAILTIISMGNKRFRIFALPLLISAQAWYLFSYTNSEGFAVFVAILLGYQAAHKDSILNGLLSTPHPHNLVAKIILIGSLVGLMLLAKPNFYFFILFLGMYLVWRICLGEFPDQKLLWKRIALVSIIGLSIYGLRAGLDYAANGPDPKAKHLEIIEANAQYLYKPSTPLNEQHIYLHLKDRSFSLDRIINKEQWGEKTFYTAFGAYGFTEYFADATYYDLIRRCGYLLMALMLLGVLVKGPPSAQLLFSMVVICSMMLIGLLLWRSWTVSFQPQGRYLLPILPMLGVLYYHIHPYIYEKAVITLTVCMFLLSVYSFVFVGIYDVEKLSFAAS